MNGKPAHGFRKYFKTKAEQAMLPLHVEMLLGHDTGLSMNYYRPTEKTLLEDYLKAVDLLTIDYQEAILQKKVDELQEKTKEDQYIIEGKLSEKDRVMQAMKEKYEQEIQAMREETNQRFNQIISMIQHNPKLAHVKPEALIKKM